MENQKKTIKKNKVVLKIWESPKLTDVSVIKTMGGPSLDTEENLSSHS